MSFNEVSFCHFRLLMLQCWEHLLQDHHQSTPTVISPWNDPRTAQDHNTNRPKSNPWHSGQQALPEKKPVHSFNTESYPVYRGPNGQQVNLGKRGALRRIVHDDNVDLSVLTAVPRTTRRHNVENSYATQLPEPQPINQSKKSPWCV